MVGAAGIRLKGILQQITTTEFISQLVCPLINTKQEGIFCHHSDLFIDFFLCISELNAFRLLLLLFPKIIFSFIDLNVSNT